MTDPEQPGGSAARPRGILSTADREYLRGERQYASYQAEKDRQDAIKERTTNAMFDLALLAEHLSDEDLREIFDVEVHELDDDEDLDDHEAGLVPPLSTMVRFLLRAENRDDADHQVFEQLGAEQPVFREFARDVEYGIRSYLAAEKQTAADVSVNITLSNVRPTDALLAEVKSGETEADLGTQATLRMAGHDESEIPELTSDVDAEDVPSGVLETAVDAEE